MTSELERALEQAGLPLACCPSCEHSEWRFEGTTKAGFDSVSCAWCSRTYTGMTALQEYAHWAERARDAARAMDARKVRQANARLRQIWEEYPDLERTERYLVCTFSGRLDGADDEIPF